MSQTLPEALAAFHPGLPLAVALSGGADSTALLLACAEKWPGQVRAMHVHHGLQAAADGFQLHCETLCARLGVPLAVRRVDARHGRGASPEDAARQARYEAFEAIPSVEWTDVAIENIAIAQHADDQVETILLALSRGAGLPGLSAMPACWQRGGLTFHRPLLAVPGPAIRDWLIARGEAWVEDPSNADVRFTRNRIRARLLPAIEAAFPHFRETFALIKIEDPEYDYELAKMAVSPRAQGKNIGWLLGRAAINKARQLGARGLYLESNTRLVPAINLYHKLGFVKVVGHASPYERSNIQMGMGL